MDQSDISNTKNRKLLTIILLITSLRSFKTLNRSSNEIKTPYPFFLIILLKQKKSV